MRLAWAVQEAQQSSSRRKRPTQPGGRDDVCRQEWG